MWQPSGAQRRIIWAIAILLALTWPPREGGSLALKAVRWLADPGNQLPAMPPPLAMGLGDDGDAVAEHDRQLAEYYEFVDRSATNRLRLRLKEAEEPLDPVTVRQLLTAVGIVAALAVWQLNGRTQR
jgi:hypothetical protein